MKAPKTTVLSVHRCTVCDRPMGTGSVCGPCMKRFNARPIWNRRGFERDFDRFEERERAERDEMKAEIAAFKSKA
jgi:hypothetical protein